VRVDVAKLLAELGVVARRSGSELRGPCPDPAHQHSGRPGPGSWQICPTGPKAGLHVCYGCGFGGGPIDLVAVVRGLDRAAAREWLAGFAGLRMPRSARSSGWRSKVALDQAPQLRFPRGSVPLWRAIDGFDRSPALRYLSGRGIGLGDVERFGIFATAPERRPEVVSYGSRLIIPVVVRDEMVDFVARLYEARDPRSPKALSGRRDAGARKELSLWGYDELDPTFPRVVVVEGIWGAVALRKAGERNVVAACGSAWSEERTQLLEPWREIVLCPDGDGAGRKFVYQASSLRFGHLVRSVQLPDGLQPDHDPERVRGLIDEAPPARYSTGLEPARLRKWGGKV